MAATTAIGMVMPIAAASIVSVGFFAWMWRAHQYDRAHGKAPWYLTISIFIVPAIYGTLGYWLKGEASTEYVDVFRVAMVAQAVTFAFLFCLSNALWAGRGKPLRSRAFPAAFALGLAVLVLSGAFTG